MGADFFAKPTMSEINDAWNLIKGGAVEYAKERWNAPLEQYRQAKAQARQGDWSGIDKMGNELAMSTIGEAKPKAPELSIEELPRKMRAVEMGFDPDKTFYHGTKNGEWVAKSGEFKTNPEGANRFLEGVYVADHPSDANNYSGYTDKNAPAPAVLPVHTEGTGFVNIEEPGAHDRLYQLLGINKAKPDIHMAARMRSTPEIGHTELLAKSYAEAKGIPLEQAWSDLPKELSKLGVSGFDIPSYGIRNVFDPTKVRSKFAKFDPRKAGSGNIAAGLGAAIGAGALGAGMMSQDAQASDIFAPPSRDEIKSFLNSKPGQQIGAMNGN